MSVKDKMSLEDRSNFFSRNYDVLADYNLIGEKIYLGNKYARFCRFCNKGYPETTFKVEAHAIPELVGNKDIFSHYECDICNEKFSRTLEDHLGKFLGLDRTISQVRGKQGVPSYKSNKSRIDVHQNQFKISNYDGDSIAELRKEQKELHIKGKRQPYIPVAVYKCLIKMALSIMPADEIKYFSSTVKWIAVEDHNADGIQFNYLPLLRAFAPGPNPFRFIKLILFKRKVDAINYVPDCLFGIAFNNYFYQIYLPLSDRDDYLMGKEIQMVYFPLPVELDDTYGATRFDAIDLKSKNITNGQETSWIMHFDSFEEINLSCKEE